MVTTPCNTLRAIYRRKASQYDFDETRLTPDTPRESAVTGQSRHVLEVHRARGGKRTTSPSRTTWMIAAPTSCHWGRRDAGVRLRGGKAAPEPTRSIDSLLDPTRANALPRRPNLVKSNSGTHITAHHSQRCGSGPGSARQIRAWDVPAPDPYRRTRHWHRRGAQSSGCAALRPRSRPAGLIALTRSGSATALSRAHRFCRCTASGSR